MHLTNVTATVASGFDDQVGDAPEGFRRPDFQ